MIVHETILFVVVAVRVGIDARVDFDTYFEQLLQNNRKPRELRIQILVWHFCDNSRVCL